MGWSDGTTHMHALIETMTKHVPDASARRAVYAEMIRSFGDDGDWDTEHECLGVDAAYDEAYRIVFPRRTDDDR